MRKANLRNDLCLLPTFELASPSTKMGFLFPAPGPESSHCIIGPWFRHRDGESRESVRAGEHLVHSLSRLFSIEESRRALGKGAEFSKVIQKIRAELFSIHLPAIFSSSQPSKSLLGKALSFPPSIFGQLLLHLHSPSSGSLSQLIHSDSLRYLFPIALVTRAIKCMVNDLIENISSKLQVPWRQRLVSPL